MPSADALPIVFHDDVGEQRWIEFLLAKLNPRVFTDDRWNGSGDHSAVIHVISTNSSRLKKTLDMIASEKEAGIKVGLVHLSDEWFRADTSFYGGSAFVLKSYYCSFIQHPAIKYIPLGYPNHVHVNPSPRLASERRYIWFFAGTRKYSRHEMLRRFSLISPHFMPREYISASQYREALFESVFVPCGMGNINPDTWRIYEALEAGSVPITERRWSIDYFGELFGDDCPIPRFTSWKAAARWVDEVRSNNGLDEIQATTAAWWSRTKDQLQDSIADFARRQIDDNAGTALADWIPPYHGVSHALRWRAEVSRYATPEVFFRRAMKHLGLRWY